MVDQDTIFYYFNEVERGSLRMKDLPNNIRTEIRKIRKETKNYIPAFKRVIDKDGRERIILNPEAEKIVQSNVNETADKPNSQKREKITIVRRDDQNKITTEQIEITHDELEKYQRLSESNPAEVESFVEELIAKYKADK